MQQRSMTYDELTPLEQCIVDFMLRQEGCSEARSAGEKKRKRKITKN